MEENGGGGGAPLEKSTIVLASTPLLLDGAARRRAGRAGGVRCCRSSTRLSPRVLRCDPHAQKGGDCPSRVRRQSSHESTTQHGAGGVGVGASNASDDASEEGGDEHHTRSWKKSDYMTEEVEEKLGLAAPTRTACSSWRTSGGARRPTS